MHVCLYVHAHTCTCMHACMYQGCVHLGVEVNPLPLLPLPPSTFWKASLYPFLPHIFLHSFVYVCIYCNSSTKFRFTCPYFRSFNFRSNLHMYTHIIHSFERLEKLAAIKIHSNKFFKCLISRFPSIANY